MKRGNRNPYTVWVIVSLLFGAVCQALAVAFVVYGAWLLYFLAQAFALAGCVATGIFIDKRAYYSWQKAQEEELMSFIALLQERYKVHGGKTDNESFEEFLRKQDDEGNCEE